MILYEEIVDSAETKRIEIIMKKDTLSPVYSALCQIMNADGSESDLVGRSEELFTYCSEGMATDSEKLLATLFLKSLNQKMHSEVITENIYDRIAGVSQIELFDILIAKFPFVKYSQELVNNAIVDILSEQESASIIDIGVGLGTQMVNVISRIPANSKLKKLVIVGVEPFTDALAIAEKNILALKGNVPFELSFIPVPDYVENFDFTTLNNLKGSIIVNASLALHHIKTMEERRATLKNIQALQPVSLFMIEPNVDHFESNFYKRFVNSWNHFYCLFKVIDQLEITNDQKNGLKLFFGREIEDIIGKKEEDRFEKHMPAKMWIDLLHGTGFTTCDDLLKASFVADPGVIVKNHKEGYLGFTYEDETALALIHAI